MQDMKECCRPVPKRTLSEAEILRELEEAILAYEETLRIADLPDHLSDEETFNPKYDWNTPIGFAMK